MLKIRLRRMGATHQPFYRLVVSDANADPRARAVEEVGIYDPSKKPVEVRLDKERIQHWVDRGAQMSPTVKKLLKRA
ncbi:MAG: 30S ribosomal protein S16 [Acidobacteria bacterium]|nr:30S ribosomal protein S16 [Acidobacteriota bacterium]